MSKTLLALTAAAGLAVTLSTGAFAQSSKAPGLQMQEKGSVSGSAGASGYSPGHQMQEKGSVSGTTGASGYAPGRATTGSSINTDTQFNNGRVKSNTHINGGAKIK
jgi:hypothetical protein